MLKARATWGAAPRGSCEDRASNRYNTDRFALLKHFALTDREPKWASLAQGGAWGAPQGTPQRQYWPTYRPCCPDTKAADGGALGRRNRPITGLVAYCSICPWSVKSAYTPAWPRAAQPPAASCWQLSVLFAALRCPSLTFANIRCPPLPAAARRCPPLPLSSLLPANARRCPLYSQGSRQGFKV